MNQQHMQYQQPQPHQQQHQMPPVQQNHVPHGHQGQVPHHQQHPQQVLNPANIQQEREYVVERISIIIAFIMISYL